MPRIGAIPAALTTITLAAMALSGCGGGTSAPAADSSSSPMPTASASPPGATATTAPAPSSSTAPTPSTSSASASRPSRSPKQLQHAMLALKDLPSGFAVEPASEDGAAPTASSRNSTCAALIKIMNTDRPAGSRAGESASFSGGQDGPFIEQSLDAMPSAKAAAAFHAAFRDSVRACRTLTLGLAGQGSSPVQVREVSAPPVGKDTYAARFTGTSGPLEGLEITMVTTRIEDVLMALTYVAAAPEDVDGATELALDKAERVLKAAASTT